MQSMVDLLQPQTSREWLDGRIKDLKEADSARSLYMAYTLCGQHFSEEELPLADAEIHPLFRLHSPSQREVARLGLLSAALEERPAFYSPKVLKLIQVADTGELITFLKYLVVLPSHEDFVLAAVEALRTNIADVFEAISLENPYPKAFFNEQQWNQMYLKAAFMQLDLTRIDGVEARSNRELARIISDYAHERWAASREIDPCIWRPVADQLDEVLLKDMKHLFASQWKAERLAAYIIAKASSHPELADEIQNNQDLDSDVQADQPWIRVRDLWAEKVK